MKKIYTLLSFVLLFSFAKAQFPAPYCAEAYSAGKEPITLVMFDSINNSTSNTTTGAAAHQNFTSISTTITQGNIYTIKVKGNTDGNFSDYITVFIDWNQNGDFADADETFNIGIIKNSTGLDSTSISGTIIVPIGATIGTTRMRVSKKWNAYQMPCNTAGYGQSEDYTLNIIASPTCSGTPPITTANGPASFCMDSLVTVYLTGITAGTGLTYQWQSTTIGGTTWVDVAGAIDAMSTFTHVAGGVDYRCKVTCTSSSITTNSTKISIASEDCGSPSNDDYCDAIELFADSVSDCKNTTMATATGDPTFSACSTPNNTVWYKYTPTTTGNVIVNFTVPASGFGLNGWLGIYEVAGSCPGTLTFTNVTATALGGCQSFGSTTNTQIIASLTAGTEYYFMIDGVSGAYGRFCISLKSIAGAAPTSCATNIAPQDSAINIPANVAYTFMWDTVATATSYSLYYGTTNPPTTLWGTFTNNSTTITPAAYNTTYYWYVVPKNIVGSMVGCDATNTTSFTTTPPPAPPKNNECDSADIVIVNGAAVNGTTIAATQSLPGSACAGFNGTADDDVWYSFTASASGSNIVTLTPTPGTSFDAVLIGYSGVCGSLSEIGCADATFGGGTEAMTLSGLTAGDVYYFRAYSYGSTTASQGSFNVTVIDAPAAPTSCATNIAPHDTATNIPVNVAYTFMWDTVANATSYDLYGGTTNPPTTFVANYTTNTASITLNAYSTTFYWYVVPKNLGGDATGCDGTNVTSFTTEDAPPPPVNDDPCDAIVLTLNGTPDCQNTAGATSVSDPTFNCSTPNNTVWYKYTPATSDTVQFNFNTPATNGLNGWLGIYTATGTCPGALTFTNISTSTLGGCKSFGDSAFGGSTTTKFFVYLQAGVDYYFMVDGVNGASGEYCLFLRSMQALPVALTKFSGARNGSTNVLSWTSSKELNNKGFEIQRSSTGNNFTTMNFVESKAINGNSSSTLNYSFIDNTPFAATTYYRLKQIDKNGRYSLSNVVAISGEKINAISITNVYPIPTTKSLNLTVLSPNNNEKVSLIVTDITGKIVTTKTTQLSSGSNAINLDVANLSSGIYLLKMICNNGCNSNTTKFIKQ